MSDRELRQYFRSVYQLAQQAAEAVALFGVLHNYVRSAWVKDFENATVNEDLFRIIASCARRTSIVTLHILCDNGQPDTCNVRDLIKRLGRKGYPTESMKQRLRPHGETIKRIRTLRTHVDAHLSDRTDWREDLGEGLTRRAVDQLLSSIFLILIDCGKNLRIRKLGHAALRNATTLLGERLIRALGEQIKAGKVGKELISVRAWEDDQESQEAEGAAQ
jgi:hypothetical protein